ncbi:hypothetical protein [Pedobacter antarcticus]|uniref:hypothetical protein n=1 Tax=Pedobacter antarcticus TaxID=34086 RepID=UPI001C580A9B|nr:hypothetical protein [Pedobacter antarcticus]
MANSWFNYNDSGSVNEPTSYAAITNPSCLGNQRLCAVNAEIQLIDNVQRPVITGALQSEISTALTNHKASTNVSLKNP